MKNMDNKAETTPIPPFRTFLWIFILLSLFGWGGLAILIATTKPDLGPRWLFYFLLMAGVTGVAVPLTYFINLRFPTNPPASGNVILREAMWIGVYASIIAWLQQGGVLTTALVLILALGFFFIEGLIRVRDLSLWKPKGPADE
jgi:hypothetical protein